MKTRLIWTEKTIFFKIFEDRVENNSLKKKIHWVSSVARIVSLPSSLSLFLKTSKPSSPVFVLSADIFFPNPSLCHLLDSPRLAWSSSLRKFIFLRTMAILFNLASLLPPSKIFAMADADITHFLILVLVLARLRFVFFAMQLKCCLHFKRFAIKIHTVQNWNLQRCH